MAQMNLIVTPAFEAALERLMRRRGFANKSEAVRAVVEEAAKAVESLEDLKSRRAETLDRIRGSWAGKSPDLPRTANGAVDWKAFKDEIHEGMP